jgi:phosphoenolpyruvate carboxykinase (GTP)
MGSIMSSEKTAAAAGTVGKVRHDPFAMLPFCGYHMADYFRHWLEIGERGDADKLPKIFYVNWFRKDPSGRWLWPGFGENSRVLAWAFRRCDDAAEAEETPIGLVPASGALDLDGLDVPPEDLDELLRVDPTEWRDELPSMHEHFAKFGEQLPGELRRQLDGLEEKLGSD